MIVFQKKLLTVFGVSQSQMSVVQGSNAKLDFFASGPIDWSDEQKARVSLLALIPISYRRQIGELCLVLPRELFFTKLIFLPSADEQEIRKMVSLQISQLLPYVPEQAVWDCVISSQKATGSDVLIFAVSRQAVMRYLRVLSSVGLYPTVVTVSSFALAGLLATVDPGGHAALFFPDRNSTEICFSADGKFYFSRSIAFGTNDFSTDKLSDFWTALRLTFESQRKNFSQYGPLSGLFLLRSSEDFPQGFLEQLTKTSGISWGDLSIEGFKKKVGPFYLPNQDISCVDAVVVSTILQQGIKNISNFLPKNFIDRHSINAGRKNMLIFISLFLMSVFSLTLAVGAPAIKKVGQIKLLDDKFKKIENPSLKLQKERQVLADLESNLENRILPLSLIEELYNCSTGGIAFSRVYVSDKNVLDLEGQAFQSSAVNDLQEKMIASALFRDVRLEHTVRRTSPMGEVVQFAISARLQNRPYSKGE